MLNGLKILLIGGDSARRAAFKIGEFDYLCGLTFSVKGFVNPNSTQNFTLVNCGYEWIDLPVYKSLEEVFSGGLLPAEQDATLSEVDSVGIYFNAKHVLYWVQEVCRHPQIKNVVIFAEDVPEKDQREIVALGKKHKVNILGPSSTGMLIPGKGRLGEIGGEWKNINLCNLDKPGPVGVITKSGTISGALMWLVSQNSSGMSGIFQIGGDPFPATDYVLWLEYFSKDPKTKVVVLAGEAGGDLEERAANWILENKPRFKVLSVISGKFLEKMPKGQKFGHAGAKQEESGFGSAAHKIKALTEAGVEVLEFHELGGRLKKFLK